MKTAFATIATLLLALGYSTVCYAELMGIVPGRSANVDRQARFAVEVGGGQYSDQLTWAAVRFNLKPTSNLVVYGDVAQVAANNLPIHQNVDAGFAGIGFGGGIMFEVTDFMNAYDLAFNSTFHMSSIDHDGDIALSNMNLSANFEQRQLSAEFVISPIDPLYENGFTWYASGGYVTTSAQTHVKDAELGFSESIRYRLKQGATFGLGGILPMRLGTLYAGAELPAGDLLLAAGFRVNF